jgi:hypothetical protein
MEHGCNMDELGDLYKHKKEGLLDGISRYHTWDKNLHNP